MATPTKPPVRAALSCAMGRRVMKSHEGAIISAVANAHGGDVANGTDGPGPRLPGLVWSVIGGFASVAGSFFWGFSDVVNEDHHVDRASWTIERLTVPLSRRGEVVDAARAFVTAFRAGRSLEAQQLWVEFFFRKLRPDFRATPDLLAHMKTYCYYAMPSAGWLLPWSSWSFAAAKAALATAFGTDDLEFIHHTFAVYGTYVDAIVPALTQREDEIRAAQASGGMPVLRLFDRVAMSTFRVGTRSSTLGGALDAATPVEAGTVIELLLSRQPLREHRFMSCCGQNLVSELTREIVDQYYDSRYTILACRAPAPATERVIPDRLRAAQEAGRWNIPDDDRYTAPAATSSGGVEVQDGDDDAPIMAAPTATAALEVTAAEVVPIAVNA